MHLPDRDGCLQPGTFERGISSVLADAPFNPSLRERRAPSKGNC